MYKLFKLLSVHRTSELDPGNCINYYILSVYTDERVHVSAVHARSVIAHKTESL